MAIDMEYLSYSRLDLFRTCPYEFYKKYIEHAEPDNESVEYFADYGSLCHAILEEFENARGLIPKNVLMDMFVNGSESRGGKVKGFNEIEFPSTFYGRPSKMRDTYWQQGMDFIGKLATADVSKVIGVELEFNTRIADDIPILHGFIDKVERDEHGIIVTDFKSSKPYTQEKCDHALQMSMYGIACVDLFGESPYKYVYDFIRFGEQIVTYRTQQQLENTKRDIADMWHEITTRTEWEPECDPFFFNTFCQYRASCIHDYGDRSKKAKHG